MNDKHFNFKLVKNSTCRLYMHKRKEILSRESRFFLP